MPRGIAPLPIPPLRRYLISCATELLGAPAVAQVFEARRHWANGALGVMFPAGAPVLLMRAICALDAGANAGECERIKNPPKG